MDPQPIGSYQEPAPLTWRERISRALFPVPVEPPHRLDQEERGRTFMLTHVGVYLDWRDRLRVLWSGWLQVRTRTYTDVEVKEAISVSEVTVIRHG